MRNFLYFLLILVTFSAALNVFIYRPNSLDTEMLEQTAKQYQVRIIRDEFGVPHIYGKRDVDTAFGLAYAHAEDDYATIEDVILATRGTLATVKGPDAAKTDYLIRLMRVWDAVNSGYDTRISQQTRDIAQAYADGINLYAARNPEKVSGFALPVRGKDIVAGFTFKLPLFYGFDKVLGEKPGLIPESPGLYYNQFLANALMSMGVPANEWENITEFTIDGPSKSEKTKGDGFHYVEPKRAADYAQAKQVMGDKLPVITS